jgi:hypothetical protein
MPTMADITVKKNDGTTDIVWNNGGPGGGDGVPAIWRPSSIGASVAKRPVARLWTMSSSQPTRIVRFTTTFPIVNATTGAIDGYITSSEEFKVPIIALDTDVNEAVAQSGNLRDHSLIVSAFQQVSTPR